MNRSGGSMGSKLGGNLDQTVEKVIIIIRKSNLEMRAITIIKITGAIRLAM